MGCTTAGKGAAAWRTCSVGAESTGACICCERRMSSTPDETSALEAHARWPASIGARAVIRPQRTRPHRATHRPADVRQTTMWPVPARAPGAGRALPPPAGRALPPPAGRALPPPAGRPVRRPAARAGPRHSGPPGARDATPTYGRACTNSGRAGERGGGSRSVPGFSGSV